MEANSTTAKSGNKNESNITSKEGECNIEKNTQEGEDDQETLKRRILAHPLFELLIESHINCLKVGLGESIEVDKAISATKIANLNPNPKSPTTSDLDVFMEEYCFALSKLREGIEEPVQETSSFIKAMYDQLRDLN